MKVSIVALILLLGKSSQSVTSPNLSPEVSAISSSRHHGIIFPSMLTPTEVIAMPPPPPPASSDLVIGIHQQAKPSTPVILSKGKEGQEKKGDNEEKKRPHIKKSEKPKKKKDDVLSCGDDSVFISKSSLQWTNPRYPFGETQRMSCVLRIKRDPKIWQEILQIKVIVADLIMSQPQNGACRKDNITLTGAQLQGQTVGRHGLQLCGEEPDDFFVTSGKKYPQHKHREYRLFRLLFFP